jgi:hypothetical protein
MIAGGSANAEAARQEWQEGYERFVALASERSARDRLYRELEIVSDEIRRRIGQHFALAEAVELYHGAERWAMEVVAEAGLSPSRPWSRDLSIVVDAAFHLYVRAAIDYVP